MEPTSASKRWAILAIVTGILVADLVTKSWALRALADGRRIDLLGGWVPLTLAFNRGAAFGLSIGTDPRWFFIPATIVAAAFLIRLLRNAHPGDRLRIVSASLVLAGASGNLIDRLRWDRGVVDFIGPIDLGFMLWPIFNVADSSITVGAILLAISFWTEDREDRETPAGEGTAGVPDPAA